MRRAVFLDRDGTLNHEVDFVRTPAQLVLLPGVPAALTRLHDAGFRLIVVTNQSGIARGYYSERDLAAIHHKLDAETGGRIDAFLHCPHLPEGGLGYGGDCVCRKPRPGLLHQAKLLLDVDFDGSFLIGDSARDLLMASGLPLRTVLVHSGKPVAAERQRLLAAGCTPDHEAKDLAAAADYVLAQPLPGVRRAAASE